MAGSPPPPDDLPTSRTGRIPQWVIDEAMGRPVENSGFRSYGTPDPLASASSAPRSRGRRWLSGLSIVAVLLALLFVGQQFGFTSFGSPTIAAAKPSNGPTPGFEEASAPLAVPAPLAAAPSLNYRFEATLADGVLPVTWSPCRPIHYVVRPLHEPPGGRAGLVQALAAVSAATGLRFVDDGPTDEAPASDRAPYQPDRYGDRWAPVLVAWATPDEVPDFGVDIAGEAGATRVTTPSGDNAYISGVVYLDPAKYLEAAALAGQAVADTIVLHELGHLVGLAHVNDPTQVMWPRGNAAGLTTFQPGDLTGLAALGRGACQPDA